MSLLGINSKLYRNTGTWDSPVWAEITGISDLSRSGSWNKATYTTRRSRIEVARKTTLGLTITGKAEVDPDDDGYNALYAAFLDGDNPIDLMVLQGPEDQNGVTGFRAEWYV